MVTDKRSTGRRRKPTPDPKGTGPEPSHHVAVRLSATQLARVDALIPLLSSPWYTASRSDAMRAVIETGLPIVENAKEGTIR